MRDSFLKYIQFEKRFSQHTITSYENDLNQFEAFLADNYQISTTEADHNSLRHWVVTLVEKQLASRSINRKIASLRTYYKFLLRRGFIKKDPTSKLQALKTDKPLPQFVNEPDMSRLLDHCEFTNDFNGMRDQLIMEMLYGTGIRLSELLNLKVSDVNLHAQTIKVLGKRNKERVIPISRSLCNLIRNYETLKKSITSTKDNELLLVTEEGEATYPMLIYRTVKKYLNLFTTIEKRSPHVLRHTFATHLLNKGAELNAVKDLLGHSSLAATQVYTHNSLDKLKKVFDQAHPKA